MLLTKKNGYFGLAMGALLGVLSVPFGGDAVLAANAANGNRGALNAFSEEQDGFANSGESFVSANENGSGRGAAVSGAFKNSPLGDSSEAAEEEQVADDEDANVLTKAEKRKLAKLAAQKEKAELKAKYRETQKLYHEGYTKQQARGTTYLRLGGGVGLGEGLMVSLLTDNTGRDTGPGLSGIAPLFNTELGYNHYAGRPFYTGMALSLDLNFGNYGAAAVGGGDQMMGFGGTMIHAMLIEAKGKLGVHIDIGKSRTAIYALLGAAVHMSQIPSLSVAGGPTFGFGFTIGSRKYPFSFYAEATVPVLMNTNNHGSIGIDLKDKIGDIKIPDINIKLQPIDVNVPAQQVPLPNNLGDLTIPAQHVQVQIPPQTVQAPKIDLGDLPSIKLPGLDMVFAPRFAVGVQIGY